MKVNNILDGIIAYKKVFVQERKDIVSLKQLEKQIAGLEYKPYSFRDSIKRENSDAKVNLIAEVKRRSPSAGELVKKFEPVTIAKKYESSGAAAVSVLTDEKFFGGSLEYISDIKIKVSLPLLRKDFIIDRYQVAEAKAAGADAILLINAVLDPRQIEELRVYAKELGMDVLVEVHDGKELKTVLEKTGAEIIGINNRDLTTFRVDINTTLELVPQIPALKVTVAESGIKTREDIEALTGANVHAVLIGETLIRAGLSNIEHTVRGLGL
ncbi:MAG: indole-3-glycerol phosphate synthase TrpC [Elusimicrobiota bacterium]